MLALIVLMFIAIDVIILLIYDIYSATQGTLEAVRFSNREGTREERGV
jgi:NADH:ubiquinone oxidoreductase subunit 3 (subunit A)